VISGQGDTQDQWLRRCFVIKFEGHDITVSADSARDSEILTQKDQDHVGDDHMKRY